MCWPQGDCRWSPTTPEACRTGVVSPKRSVAPCPGQTAQSSSLEMTTTGASTRPNCRQRPQAAGQQSYLGWAAGMPIQGVPCFEDTHPYLLLNCWCPHGQRVSPAPGAEPVSEASAPHCRRLRKEVYLYLFPGECGIVFVASPPHGGETRIDPRRSQKESQTPWPFPQGLFPLQALEISFLLKVQRLSMMLHICPTRKDANLNREIGTTMQDYCLPLRTSWLSL